MKNTGCLSKALWCVFVNEVEFRTVFFRRSAILTRHTWLFHQHQFGARTPSVSEKPGWCEDEQRSIQCREFLSGNGQVYEAPWRSLAAYSNRSPCLMILCGTLIFYTTSNNYNRFAIDNLKIWKIVIMVSLNSLRYKKLTPCKLS